MIQTPCWTCGGSNRDGCCFSSVDAIKKKPQESSPTAEEKKVISEQWGLDFIKVLGVWCEGLQESPFKRLGRCPVESWLNDSTVLSCIKFILILWSDFFITRTCYEHDSTATARMTVYCLLFHVNCICLNVTLFLVCWMINHVFPLVVKWEWGSINNFLYKHSGERIQLK